MKCINCGSHEIDSEGLCKNCGTVNDINKGQSHQKSDTSSSKRGVTKIIVGVITVLVVVIGGVFGVRYFLGDKTDNNLSGNSSNNINNESNSKADYSTYTSDVPRSERNIDYYWNINTDTFDKTKFDGKISVFGTVMNTKLTGKTLKDAGFMFVSMKSEDGNATEETTMKYDSEEKYYHVYGLLYANNKVYPTYNYNVSVDLLNYQGINSIYDDTSEVYFSQNSIYQDKDNVIVPYMENVDYSKLTIDDIIDHLGAPTYVEGRVEKLDASDTSSGSTSFSYLYVYDDYVFKFNFMYNERTGCSVVGLIYMGRQKFNSPTKVFNYDTYETDVYESYSKYLDEQYEKYLKSIG